MKNQIKNFYEDHKNEIIVGAVMAVITATFVSLHVAEAHSIDRVKASRTPDGDVHVFVIQKNGQTNRFDGPPKELK